MYLLGVFYSIAAAVCWAMGPVLLKKSLSVMDFPETCAVRTLSFVAASLAFSLLDPHATVLWKYPGHLLFFVFLNILVGNVVGDISYFRAIQEMGVSKTVAATCSYPLFVTFISATLLGEQVTIPVVLGTGCIIAGLLILKTGGSESDGSGTPWRGYLYALWSAVCWAAMLTLQKWLLSVNAIPAATVTLWRALFLMAVSWAYWILSTRKSPEKRARLASLGAGSLGWGLAAGTVGLALGGYMFALGIEIIPVSIATPISASSPILAAFMGVLLFKERMRPLQWMGIFCIVAGVVAVSS